QPAVFVRLSTARNPDNTFKAAAKYRYRDSAGAWQTAALPVSQDVVPQIALVDDQPLGARAAYSLPSSGYLALAALDPLLRTWNAPTTGTMQSGLFPGEVISTNRINILVPNAFGSSFFYHDNQTAPRPAAAIEMDHEEAGARVSTDRLNTIQALF